MRLLLICVKSVNRQERDQFKSFIGVCKFKFMEYKNKNGIIYSNLTPSAFKSVLSEQKISLPSYEDFKNGKSINFAENAFTTTDRSYDLNSTTLYANTEDCEEQLKIKKKPFIGFKIYVIVLIQFFINLKKPCALTIRSMQHYY